MAVLDAEVLRQVRRLEIRTRRAVAEAMAGGYVSVFRGAGIEFDEVREYVPGDDVRSIDWNVTARHGRPFVKKYVEERELTLLFVVDRSPSMDFGSVRRTKEDTATEFAVLLSIAAIRHHDKVGLVLFGRGEGRFVPARKGFRHALRVVAELASPPGASPSTRGPGAGGGIAGALDFLGKVFRRRAIVFLVSDFLEERFARSLAVASRRHDLVAVRVLDPREETLPAISPLLLEDPETGEVLALDASDPAVRAEYERRSRERRARFEETTARAGVDRMELRTDRPVIDPVLEFFRRRERRGARE
ncbi:MAG TPA: DUF58 domain-containing protein [Planctomycetota bacterium]|jgi:uncharacterized protein (DUF58 family)|nr:DUF58 domain-containing protein [Planctomycetota bacterium]